MITKYVIIVFNGDNENENIQQEQPSEEIPAQ
jgi:hypothetical protein